VGEVPCSPSPARLAGLAGGRSRGPRCRDQAAAALAVLARDENDRALAELRRQGFALTRLTTEGRGAFAAAAKGAYDKAAAAVGPEIVRSAETLLAAEP
jgi:hypothetical protein